MEETNVVLQNNGSASDPRAAAAILSAVEDLWGIVIDCACLSNVSLSLAVLTVDDWCW